MTKALKTELYSLPSAICAELNTETRQFKPGGKPFEGTGFQDDYQVYEVPITEYNYEDKESFDHLITAVSRGNGTFEVDFTLSY